MKREHQQSENFTSDDDRTGILVEIVDGGLSHITLARKGSSTTELTEKQLEQLAELIPEAAKFVRGIREVVAEG